LFESLRGEDTQRYNDGSREHNESALCLEGALCVQSALRLEGSLCIQSALRFESPLRLEEELIAQHLNTP
jgi:hypothetical protein